MEPATIERYGDELFDALSMGKPICALTDREPGITLDDAYAIQERLVARRLAANGERIVGKKIGVTSRAVMDMLGVDQPDFGQLLSGMWVADGAVIEAAAMIAPRAEGEIAFVLKKDLRGPGVTMVDVLAATDYVSPCFEIVDSRIRDWKIRIQDTVADNGSAGAFVLGEARVDPRKVDLALVGMTLEKNGAVATTGAGAAALGHPGHAIAWLANILGCLGVSLKAGEVLLSGSLGALVPAAGGDHLAMSIGGLGSTNIFFA